MVANTQTAVMNTQMMVADAGMTVTNTQTIVEDTQVTVTNIEKTVAEIHRDMLVGQKGGSGQNNSVGETHYLQTTERLMQSRLTPGQ